MCSQSAPALTMRFDSLARFAKSHESMEGAIFGAGMVAGTAVRPSRCSKCENYQATHVPAWISVSLCNNEEEGWSYSDIGTVA